MDVFLKSNYIYLYYTLVILFWLQSSVTQMVSKLCCLLLMEVMYSRLDQSELKGMDSRINSIYCDGNPKDGKELTKTITT